MDNNVILKYQYLFFRNLKASIDKYNNSEVNLLYSFIIPFYTIQGFFII